MADLYADPELWLATTIGQTLDVKGWADPKLPPRWDFTDPLVHIQRPPNSGDNRLTLDDALIEVDVYANLADDARDLAARVWTLIRRDLPGTVRAGVYVAGAVTVSAPHWLPDPAVYRRAAAYRLYLRRA